MSWSRVIKNPDGHTKSIHRFKLESNPQIKIQKFIPLERDNSAKREQEIQEKANSIIQQAEEEAQKIKENAFQEGFVQGKEEGTRLALEQMQGMLREIQAYLSKLKSLDQTLRKESEQEIVKLASAIAQKIILQELKTDPSIVSNIVRAALTKVPFSSKVKVRLSPADWEYVTSRSFDTTEYREIIFEPDNSITPGGCYLETDFGEVDARLDEQLQEIERVFQRLIPQPEPADKKK